MNALNVIKPYRWEGMWVFDDPDKELVKEALVSGADDLLDLIVGEGDSCKLLFSAKKFPDAQFKVDWVREEGDDGFEFGNWYHSETHEQNLWLCPALFKYFDEAPKEIHIKVIL